MNHNSHSIALSLAQQNYVECISDAVSHHGHAHVSALAEQLGVSKPSVVQMIARLVELDMVKRHDAEVLLSAAGQKVAKELGSRHALLRDFMVQQLGMSPKIAETEACRMEHAVSPVFVRALRSFREEGTG